MSVCNRSNVLYLGSQALVVFAFVTTTGCGQNNSINQSDLVIKSTASLKVSTALPNTHPSLNNQEDQLTSNVPITVVSSAFTTMAVDSTKFMVPTITPAILSLGSLTISALTDNNLKVCGQNGTTRCTQALFRMYTIGQAGAGLYNTVDGYGAPLSAVLGSGAPVLLPLGPDNKAVVETLNISSQKNVLRMSDFTPPPVFNVLADFSNAGVGSYAATLVIEYALAP